MDIAQALIAENAAFAELFRDADLSTPVPTCPEWEPRSADAPCRARGPVVRPDRVRAVDGGHRPAHGGRRQAARRAGQRTRLVTRRSATAARRRRPNRRRHPRCGRSSGRARPSGGCADACTRPRCTAPTPTGRRRRVLRPGRRGRRHHRVPRAGVRPRRRRGPGGRGPAPGDGQSLHLHATDPGLGEAGEWTILGRPDGIAVDHEHGKATTALRGPARDLLLAVVRRGAAADLGLEIFGDPAIWDTWLARTPF